ITATQTLTLHDALPILAILTLVSLAAAALAQTMPKPDERRTLTQVMDRALTNAEKEFVSAAEAMPEDKYAYAPTDGEFKGVRTRSEEHTSELQSPDHLV